MSNIQDLAAALNGHEITDQEGQIPEEQTPVENSATQETSPVEKSDLAEKSAEETVEAPKAENNSDENAIAELAEDETGNRYVPEKRFKEVYAKAKQAERELETLKKTQADALLQGLEKPAKQARPTSKEDLLEAELLRATLPQFNPESDQYSEHLDSLGFQIYEANKEKGMTRIEAARQAVKTAKAIAQKEVEALTEARKVKALQSDQGITSRVSQSRGQSQEIDINTANDKELEEYLRKTGQW